jgi:hypothetical protein
MMRIFIIDTIGNLTLFGLFYYWLGLSAASAGSLVMAILVAIVLAALAAYLVAFGFNRDPIAALGKVPVMMLWLVVALTVLVVLMPFWNWAVPVGNWLGSALTFGTRTPIKPAWISTAWQYGVNLIGAFILTAILLPAAARAVQTGSLRDWRPIAGRSYLLTAALYLFIGVWVPWTLFWYIPRIDSFAGQMASFGLRMALAFSLYVGAWLVFAWHCRGQALPPEGQHSR